jgi:hypothetical protein
MKPKPNTAKAWGYLYRDKQGKHTYFESSSNVLAGYSESWATCKKCKAIYKSKKDLK